MFSDNVFLTIHPELSTVIYIVYSLKITSVHEVPRSVICCDNVHYLVHVKENSVTCCLAVIVTMSSQEVLDL
jgi:hypothetical protein